MGEEFEKMYTYEKQVKVKKPSKRMSCGRKF
jgi:hypothetical protein